MKWIPWLLVLPVVIIRGFTTLYPILMTVKNSFVTSEFWQEWTNSADSKLSESFFRSKSAYIHTIYSSICSGIYDITCNIRRVSCSDIKYEV